jgi:ABC-type Na+ transport system ATPase subunit NatA
MLRRSSEETELAIRRRTVFVPDQAFLPKLRTGREWLLGLGTLYEIDIDRLIDHVDRLLQVFELAKLGDSPVSSYSSGQKKKLALCGAFVTEASLMLLDEPFSGGLDPSGILALKRLIERLTSERKAAVVLTTPVPELVEEIADLVVVLREGQIIAQGSVEELKQQTGGCRSLGEALERLVFPETLANLDHYFGRPTPWTSRLPLPLGPIHWVWQDALFLAPTVLLAWGPEARLIIGVPFAFVVIYIVLITVSLFATGERLIGYGLVFLGGLALYFAVPALDAGEPLWLALTVCLLAYPVLWCGLRRSLAQFANWDLS